VSAPDVLPTRPLSGPVGEAVAAVLTAVGCVLLGAPVGLVWAAVTPRVEIVLADGRADLADPTTSSFIAADGIFLALVAAAGLVSGVAAWWWGRRHGPGCVLGLVVGGLLAAEVARRTGELIGLDEARAAVQSGREGVVELAVRLRSMQARAGWPVAALAALLLLTLLDARVPRRGRAHAAARAAASTSSG
jgi:hypothetical protein